MRIVMVIIIDNSTEQAKVDAIIRRDKLIDIVEDNTPSKYRVDAGRFSMATSIFIRKTGLLGFLSSPAAQIYANKSILGEGANALITVYDPDFEKAALKIATEYEQLIQQPITLTKDYSNPFLKR